MTAGTLFLLLFFLACPLMMLMMMRGMGGMHGGHGDDGSDGHHGGQVIDTTARDARVAELEREVARLREAQRSDRAAGTRR